METSVGVFESPVIKFVSVRPNGEQDYIWLVTRNNFLDFGKYPRKLGVARTLFQVPVVPILVEIVMSLSFVSSMRKSPLSAYFREYELEAPLICEPSIPFLLSSSLA